MKKTCISFLSCIIILLLIIGFFPISAKNNEQYLRIHIRANSNTEQDQAVKYSVKKAVVDYLTPYIANCKTKEQAEQIIRENLKNIESVSNAVLLENGHEYSSSASVINEEFPERKYLDYTLESGYYDALIINLGSGKGDNWWCVVYPPLCFTSGETGYVYKSKILEVIKNFYKDK